MRESEAEAVRVAVEPVLAGASLRSVARSLNTTGLTTSMKGRLWDAHSVRAVLLRSRNAGLRDHQGQVIGPANWPAIVPEEQWRAVVTKLSDPSRRTSPSDARVKWLGSGIYRCAGCERPSLRVSTAGRGIPCYRCPGPRGTTGHVVRKAGPLDAYIDAVIVERLSRPDAIELLRPAAPEVNLSTLRATASAARVRLAEIAGATGTSPLAGLVDAPDPGAVWAGLDIGRRRAVLDCLMTVTVLPITRSGPGFDPNTVRIDPKQA